MSPEEFFHLDRINQNVIYEMRVRSLGWVLDCFRIGKIRRNTIKNLIEEPQLHEILEYLLEQERYEECAIVRDILNEVYNGKYEEKIN